MNSETSYLTPQQKKFMVKKLRELKRKNDIVLCVKSSNGDMAFIEASKNYKLTCSWDMIQEINSTFGEGSIHLKVDKSVPEIRKKRFFKKAE